jgi:myo-inositol-1(or 4)-monophosphatase
VGDVEFLSTAEEAARRAGDVLEEWGSRFTVSEKSRSNLVTEADFASQEAIHKLIKSRFPDHGFLGEEGLDQPSEGCDYRWIIDPLDGTSNYVHRFPYYAVSIALESAGELLVGVIFDPNRNEMFTAVRGQGSRRNGVSISPTDVDRLAGAMAVASLPVGTRADDPAVARFLKVLPVAQSLQRTGSAALNLAYVACGRIDLYWSSSLKPWDMAAGALIVREAGGRVTRLDNTPFSLEEPEILASNGSSLHAEFCQLFQ